MHVAIAIVAFRNPEDISSCLAALASTTYADFEVVICENGGRDAYESLTKILPPALPGGQPVRAFLAPGNLGYAGGVNAAMAMAPGADAWWVLNPDTEAEPSALGALVARLEQGDCEAVGGVIYLPDGHIQAYGGRWRAWMARAVSLGRGQPLDAPVDVQAVERLQSYINGASMLVGRRFLEITGPMREEYFLYGEEVEWCLRARARGARLGFAPRARVLHRAGATTGSNVSIRTRPRTPIYLDERNKMLVTRDCFPARLPVAAVAALALVALRFARKGAWRQFGYGLSGWAAGVLNRRGPPSWIEGAGRQDKAAA